MTTVFIVLFVQALLGGFDNLWHHELAARLPSRRAARRELVLHALREAIYAVLFVGFAWLEWLGPWALLPAALLLVELAITCADFLEEDRSRRLPPFERVLHTVLATGYGVLLGVIAPVLLAWVGQPAGLRLVDHGIASWFFTLAGCGVAAWSLRNALAAHRLRSAAERAPNDPPLRGPAVLVTGATGFIGSALVEQLQRGRQRVILHVRDALQARATFGPHAWVVEHLDDIPAETRIAAVVHLAGAPVLGLPWTARRREQLVASRTGTMQQLLALMRRLEQTPDVLVSASAVGFYGVPAIRRLLDERAAPQPGRFQSDLCIAIEHEARRAEALGVRVVRLRFGIVLGTQGGAYPQLALAARLGFGARLGSGEQAVPWIHLNDAVGLIRFALNKAHVMGAVNAVAPQVATQANFSDAMAASFGRAVHLRMPGWALRTALGEMSELLLGGQWVAPVAALAAGYRFEFASLQAALQALSLAESVKPSPPSAHMAMAKPTANSR